MHLFHSEITCSEQGLLQRASPLSKVVLLITAVTYSATRGSAEQLWPVAVMLLALLTLSGIRLYKITFLMVVPLLTATLFAAYSTADTELVLARSAVGVLAALMFFFTTSSYDCMGILSPLLPTELADGVYLTYRTVFILGSRFGEALQGLQLRGLYRPTAVVNNIRTLAGVVGNILCDSLDSAERMGKVMVLRGISGALGRKTYQLQLSRWDIIPALSTVVLLAAVLGGFKR